VTVDFVNIIIIIAIIMHVSHALNVQNSRATLLGRSAPVMVAVQVFVKSLTSDRVALAVRDSCAIREMKARLATPLGCPPHLMRLIFEGNELCDEGLLREHGVTDGAVILLLRRGELHHIQWVLQRLMQVTSELQHAVTAHEEYEENLDDAADYFTLTARAAGPLLVHHRTHVRRLRCRERLYRLIFG